MHRTCPLLTQSGHWASLNDPDLNRYDAPILSLGEAMRRREFTAYWVVLLLHGRSLRLRSTSRRRDYRPLPRLERRLLRHAII